MCRRLELAAERFEMAEMRRQHKLKQKRAVGEDGEKAEEQIASIKAMAAVSATTVEEQMARDRNAAEQQKVGAEQPSHCGARVGRE